MMKYLVTGGTGFIGRFMIDKLLQRDDNVVYVLMRRASADKFAHLRKRLDTTEERLIPVWGDITRAGIINDEARTHLVGEIDHVFHLAAVYDMNMSNETANRVNIQGTENIVELTNALAGADGVPPCL